jgi:hypothetical protein
MPILKFSSNWNKKLYCTCFTSFRLYNRNKYRIGEEYTILLKIKGNYKKVFDAQLINIISMQLDEIPEYFCRLDTGYSKHDFIKIVENMYKNMRIDVHTEKFMFLLFKKINSSKPVPVK